DPVDPGAEMLQLFCKSPVDLNEGGVLGVPATQSFELLGRVLVLHGTLNELEPRLDHLELAGHELLRLDEDVLSHPNLAKVVQETRIPQLFELVVGQVDVSIFAGLDLSDRASEVGGQRLDAA